MSFRARYGDAVISDDAHFYAIAASGSLTHVDAFERFCKDAEIGLVPELPGPVRAEAVAACYRVEEARYDPALLRGVCRRELEEAGVSVRLDTSADLHALEEFEVRVLTSYSSLNELVSVWRMQFEVCEIPVVRLPAPYAGRSVVVLDGPFMSFDPIDRGRHALYHVDLSIHHRSVGDTPSIPPHLEAVLDRGPLDASSFSTFDRVRKAGRHFFIEFDPVYDGSMFALRAVLPDLEATDARPTLIDWVDGETLVVFSGKVVTAVQAAARITELVGEQGRSSVTSERWPRRTSVRPTRIRRIRS